MKAVIVAAGQGTRLWPMTEHCPKPLIKLLGKPIVGYVLDALHEAGVKEVVIVVGYHGRQFEERLGQRPRDGMEVSYVNNRAWRRGNGVSVAAAERLVADDPFLLLMGDHIVEPGMIGSLISTSREFTLCVDRTPKYPPQLKDPTKVLVDRDGYIERIGKDLAVWNCTDTGVFLCEPVIFKAVDAVSNMGYSVSISGCLRWLIGHGFRIKTHDVSGGLWLDIDTPDDLRFAETLMTNISHDRVRAHNLFFQICGISPELQ